MDQKILDRILKILALANSTSFTAEAASARAMAEALIAKHNIELSEAESNERNRIVVKLYTPFSTTAMWEQLIADAVADLCGCAVFYIYRPGAVHADGTKEYHSFEFVGLVPNVEACMYIHTEVNRQRKNAWIQYRGEGGSDSFHKFCFGFARGLESKINRLVSPAQITESERAKVWYRSRHMVTAADPIGGRGSSQAGIAAGGTASLHRGTAGAAPPPLRITR